MTEQNDLGTDINLLGLRISLMVSTDFTRW
jgi:hypothetical protein